MKYRKKPVVVEATQWFKLGDHPRVLDGPLDDCPEFIYEHHGWVQTPEGGHIVTPGDYIITGVVGEIYPCKPNIFEMTYELVEQP
jgi:hypothetical protein